MRQFLSISENKEHLIKAEIENRVWNTATHSVFLVNMENITPMLLNVGLQEVEAVMICSDNGGIEHRS